MLTREEVNNAFVQDYYDAVIENVPEAGDVPPRIDTASAVQFGDDSYLVSTALGPVGRSVAIFSPGKRVRITLLVHNVGAMLDELLARLAAEYPLVRISPSRDGQSATASVFSIFEAEEGASEKRVKTVTGELMKLHADLVSAANTIRACC